MKYKKLMLVTLLLLAILTIGAVSASDDLASDVAGEVSDESDDLSVDNFTSQDDELNVYSLDETHDLNLDVDSDENKLTSNPSNFSTIEDRIDGNIPNQTIELSGYYESIGAPISIQSVYGYQNTLTINGNGVILDAKGLSAIIHSIGTNLVLNDINFVNSYNDFDGSWPAVYSSNLTINNCTFVNCTPGKSGGGGSAISCYGYLVVNDCRFVNCSNTGRGGAIVFVSCTDNEGNCSILNCSFVNCSSTTMDGGGGAIFFESDYGEKNLNCNVSNCSFIDCSSGADGGAIEANFYTSNNNVNVLECNFVNCFSGNTSTADGGAIHFSKGNFSVSDCTFLNCHAASEGGAIILFDSNSSVNDCSFVNCSASLPNYSLDVAQGGAIYLIGCNSSVSNCSFMDCYATYEGGAIQFKDGYYSVTDSDFVKCCAGYAGGAISSKLYNGDVMACTVSNCRFVNCSASEYGGGIYFDSNNSKLSDSIFEDNTAKNGSDWYSKYNIANAITKLTTSIEASKVTATYGVSKSLTVTLKDANGNVLSNKQVKLVLNGRAYYKNTTSDGKVSFAVPTNLVPKSYNAELSFAGEGKYIASGKTMAVAVKKATPKLIANAKTFKKSVKTKKYAVTLKNNLNKVLKNTKVTIKVNKKTYTAKTNSKGVATFKITKLTKKGKYTATVKYAGSKYYNAKSVNVKITVK